MLPAGISLPEYRPSREWRIIFGIDTPQTFRNRTNGIGDLIRTIKNETGRKYRIHLDDLPAGTKSLPLRQDKIEQSKGEN